MLKDAEFKLTLDDETTAYLRSSRLHRDFQPDGISLKMSGEATIDNAFYLKLTVPEL